MAGQPQAVDLGGPEASRFWLVTSDHDASHPDARNAAIYARVTGSVGATYNDVSVSRLEVYRESHQKDVV